jgi:hypothetical protein
MLSKPKIEKSNIEATDFSKHWYLSTNVRGEYPGELDTEGGLSPESGVYALNNEVVTM